MPLIQKATESYDRIMQEGFLWLLWKSWKMLRDFVCPPWNCLYWIPVSESICTITSANIYTPSSDKAQSLEVRVFASLSELRPQEYQALIESVGASDIPVYETRLAEGVELHVLFIGEKVAGTLSFVFGKTRNFQHVVLTDRDAMALDGRIDRKHRGRGLYRTFLILSIAKLKSKGIERLFIDTNENNLPANRAYKGTGFRSLVRYKTRWGRYRFDIKPI